jgi:hypothetical protein
MHTNPELSLTLTNDHSDKFSFTSSEHRTPTRPLWTTTTMTTREHQHCCRLHSTWPIWPTWQWERKPPIQHENSTNLLPQHTAHSTNGTTEQLQTTTTTDDDIFLQYSQSSLFFHCEQTVDEEVSMYFSIYLPSIGWYKVDFELPFHFSHRYSLNLHVSQSDNSKNSKFTLYHPIERKCVEKNKEKISS